MHQLDGDCFKVSSSFNDREEKGGDLILGDGQHNRRFYAVRSALQKFESFIFLAD